MTAPAVGADLLTRAVAFAVDRHQGQYDKCGQPYILHLFRVMNDVDAGSAVRQAAAILHDVVEDEKATLDEVNALFGGAVAHTVDLLTRKKGETYYEFILRVASDDRAAEIKKADLRDNMRLDRIPRDESVSAMQTRLNRYTLAYLFLTGALDAPEYRKVAQG